MLRVSRSLGSPLTLRSAKFESDLLGGEAEAAPVEAANVGVAGREERMATGANYME